MQVACQLPAYALNGLFTKGLPKPDSNDIVMGTTRGCSEIGHLLAIGAKIVCNPEFDAYPVSRFPPPKNGV